MWGVCMLSPIVERDGGIKREEKRPVDRTTKICDQSYEL